VAVWIALAQHGQEWNAAAAAERRNQCCERV
jgi:hypothetical protein